MPFTPADSNIFGQLFSDRNVAEIFSDERYLRSLLEVEGALARAEARLGLIPASAGEIISTAAKNLQPDLAALRAGVEQDGFPVIELLRQLRKTVEPALAAHVHHGATTQDILDTGLVLQIRAALGYIEPYLTTLIDNLAEMAERHRHTLMAGRTHSQQAQPVTFGLKAAGWLAPLVRDRARLAELKPRLLVVQLGGAAGTLAALGEQGLEVQAALAAELRLAQPPMPWHTQRDSLAELAGWLSLVTGSLGKMAQDIILLAQSEIGEVRESADLQHGGSSVMPQKSNPISSELILAAARSNAGHLADMHHALINEHERGTHAWYLEWLALPPMFAATSAALKQAVLLSQNLQVDTQRMAENVRATRGLLLSEALTAALAPTLGLSEAKRLVGEAARAAVTNQRHLFDVAREKTSADIDWDSLRHESRYLGASDAFIDRVLQAARQV